MGCAPSVGPPTAIKPADQIDPNEDTIFTIDERLKLKEVWVLAKQNNLKKIGDDVMSRALDKNSTLISYWQSSAFLDQGDNLNFGEHESCVNTDLLWKQAYKQHGYKILEKIDHLIMIMVTRISAPNSNDRPLKEYCHQVGATHVEFKIRQDHIDIIGEAFMESLKDLMYRNGTEWTIKHELTWMKLYSLITTQFVPSTSTTTTKTLT